MLRARGAGKKGGPALEAGAPQSEADGLGTGAFHAVIDHHGTPLSSMNKEENHIHGRGG